ncbi:gonadal somatic cell derived factor [Chanos chanos]|uniref:Gonadal somatic cell derived factor n=1 Tax=Chanos chanos TaxID=29144 RepID=A0A6J2UVS4_CHACN|nr:bone morphogenetic protein 5-like [Chanos chanos]
MCLVLFVLVMLLGCPLGKTFILYPSEKDSSNAQPSPIKTVRCNGESLQSIRKTMLEALNLQREPQLSIKGMTQLRDQWKAAFKATGHVSPPSLDETGNKTLLVDADVRNSTDLQCCQMSSQIFIQDLGWDSWVIYPESFTYMSCVVCDHQRDLSTPHCREHHPNAPQLHQEMPCCKPTGHEFVPFLYLDEKSSLVIASVRLTRECGCGPGTDSPLPKP